MKKTLQELTIKDNFMFGAVMTDESICREFLEITLGIPIGRVVVDKEKSLVYHPEYKGVRLDVYAQDENQTLYNVEMQVAPKPALNRRARYYSSELDMEALQRGKGYSELPDNYVIFICDFDPFGMSLYRYTFTNICHEINELSLNDGCQTIFLSTCGKNDSDVPELLIKILNYIGTGQIQNSADNDFITRMHTAVKNVKASRDMEGRFMILKEMLQEERSEGYAEGWENAWENAWINAWKNALLTLLESKGTIPEDLKKQIEAQTDPDIFKRWIKLAAKTDSIESFHANM